MATQTPSSIPKVDRARQDLRPAPCPSKEHGCTHVQFYRKSESSGSGSSFHSPWPMSTEGTWLHAHTSLQPSVKSLLPHVDRCFLRAIQGITPILYNCDSCSSSILFRTSESSGASKVLSRKKISMVPASWRRRHEDRSDGKGGTESDVWVKLSELSEQRSQDHAIQNVKS